MDMGRIGYFLLHPVTFLIASTLLVMGGGNSLWKTYRDQLPNTPRKSIDEVSIKINDPGPWSTPGTPRFVTDQIALLDDSVLNPGAVGKIAEIVASVPAIESVREVSKSSSEISIVANWRQPVAVVEMPAGYFRLVDRQGMVLDRQVTSEAEALQWLRIRVVKPGGQFLADWQIWPDSRIRSAAAIAGEVVDDWREMGLVQVITYRLPDDLGPSTGTFELWTAQRAKVIWSDNGAAADPTIVQKRLKAIRAWMMVNGSLDTLAARSLILDVRSGAVKLIPDKTTTQTSENGQEDVFLF